MSDTNHYDAMTAIKGIIDGLSLSPLAGGVVIQEVVDYNRDTNTPCLDFISISPFTTERIGDPNGQENIQEDATGFPILIAIIGAPDATKLATRLSWRRQILSRMRNTDLGLGAQGCYQVVPTPLDIVTRQDLVGPRKLFVSAIVATPIFENQRP